MSDFQVIYMSIAPTDDGDYLTSALKVLFNHGWILRRGSSHYSRLSEGIEQTKWVAIKEDHPELLTKLSEQESQQSVVSAHLFWEATELYLTVTFHPEGRITFNWNGFHELNGKKLDFDWYIQNTVTPLEESPDITFLEMGYTSQDSKDEVSEDWEQTGEHSFSTTYILSSKTLKLNELNEDLLAHIKNSGDIWLKYSDRKGVLCIWKSDDGEEAGIQISIDINEPLSRIHLARSILDDIIHSIAESKKITDGPHLNTGHHVMEIKFPAPTLNSILPFIHSLSKDIYDIQENDDLLFTYR